MIRFLRRVFGRKGPSVFADEAEGDEQYDAGTQEMVLSSLDLLEHIASKGENLGSERVINHFFSGEPADVSRAVSLFDSMYYLTDVPEPHLLHVVTRSSLSVQWVKQTIPEMCCIAGEFELTYDGWDCGPEIGPK